MKKIILILLLFLSFNYSSNAQNIVYDLKPDTTQYVVNDTIYEACKIKYLSFYVSEGRVLSDYNKCLKQATVYMHADIRKVPVRYNESRTKMYYLGKEFLIMDKGNFIMYVLLDNHNSYKLDYDYIYIFDKTYNGFTKVRGASI